MKNKNRKLRKNALSFDKKILSELNKESLNKINGGDLTDPPTTIVTGPLKTLITRFDS